MEHEALNEDLKIITEALADVMIERKIPVQTMLMGIRAFLMTLQAGGHADAAEICQELTTMADYYHSLVLKN